MRDPFEDGGFPDALPGDGGHLERRESARNDAGAQQLVPATFLRRVVASVVSRLDKPDARLNSETRGRLAKLWYGEDKSIHYEIWVHERTGQLELGLHCEST